MNHSLRLVVIYLLSAMRTIIPFVLNKHFHAWSDTGKIHFSVAVLTSPHPRRIIINQSCHSASPLSSPRPCAGSPCKARPQAPRSTSRHAQTSSAVPSASTSTATRSSSPATHSRPPVYPRFPFLIRTLHGFIADPSFRLYLHLGHTYCPHPNSPGGSHLSAVPHAGHLSGLFIRTTPLHFIAPGTSAAARSSTTQPLQCCAAPRPQLRIRPSHSHRSHKTCPEIHPAPSPSVQNIHQTRRKDTSVFLSAPRALSPVSPPRSSALHPQPRSDRL